jgi:hypothetical protein
MQVAKATCLVMHWRPKQKVVIVPRVVANVMDLAILANTCRTSLANTCRTSLVDTLSY